MAKDKFRKWNGRINTNDRIEQIAIHSLRYRTAAVQHYLKLATKKASENTAYVHQLRVWSRRCNESLRFFRNILPQKQAKKLNRLHRKVRKSANNARDLDVLIDKYSTQYISHENPNFIHFLTQERGAAQLPIQELYFYLNNGKVLRKCYKTIEHKLHSQQTEFKKFHQVSFEQLAKTNLQLLAADFFDSMLLSHTHPEELHKTRIYGKRLRYAFELARPALPAKIRKEVYKSISDILTIYGNYNDAHVFQEHLQDWIKSSNDIDLVCLFQELYYKENAEKKKIMRHINECNSYQQVYELREKFNSLFSYNSYKKVA
ncbi:MAG: CHAD domain-containing protein [Gammaproteobacteria bacterium]